MSVYLNGTGDTVRIIDSGTTLTIGTGAVSMGMWVYVPSSPGANRDVMWLTPAASISGVSYMGCIYRTATNSFQAFWESASETSNDTYSISTSTWYWVVVSRDGSNNISCKVFDDSTSTTPLQNSTGTASFNWTTLDTFLIGQTASTDPSCVMQVQNYKVHTGVQWSNAECRTESQNYGIQTAGGTNRLCWKFTDIDADTDGLNEIGGAGPNFTNSGAIADAGAPTQLSAGGTTFYFLDSAASGSNFGQLQVGGSAPSTATTPTGWTVDTVAPTAYALMAYASERLSSTFSGTAQPAGNPDNSLGDCFRSTSTMSGDFATGVWTIAVPVIAVSAAAGQDGRVRVRLWKSSNATGTSPTEITSGAVAGTTVTNLTTGAEQVSTVTTGSITGFSMANEYLFVQIAWEITGAAT